MAPKGLKRPAGAAAASAKRGKGDPMLKSVQKTIEGADFLPENCRAMLVAGLSSYLGVCSDERHEFQNRFVNHIAQLMAQSKTKMEEALKAEEENVKSLEGSKSSLDAKVADAAAAAAAMQDATVAKTNASVEANGAVASAKATLSEKKKAKKVGDAEAADDALKAEHESLTSVISGTLAQILSGDMHEDPLAHYNALKPLLPLLKLDDALMAALPTACGKKTEERGAFDQMAIEALKTKMTEKCEELAKQIQEAAPAAEARATAVTDAENGLSSAIEQQAAAKKDLASAKEAEHQADADLKAAKAEVHSYAPTFDKATAARDEKSIALQQFVEYDMMCFETLKEKKTKQPEPEPATEEPAAAAPEAES